MKEYTTPELLFLSFSTEDVMGASSEAAVLENRTAGDDIFNIFRGNC